MPIFEIKNKIKSLKNTEQITKALEIIAATRQKQYYSNLRNHRFARNALRQKLVDIQSFLEKSVSPEEKSPYFKINSSNRALIISVMSKRGLCGALNSKLLSSLINHKSILEKNGLKVEIICVNRMSRRYLRGLSENIITFFDKLSENPSYDEVYPLLDMIKSGYNEEKYKEVYISYPEFITIGQYVCRISQVLPINLTDNSSTKKEIAGTYIIEPSPLKVLNEIAELYLELEIMEALLSTIASENAARMISMKKANDNIKGITGSLLLDYNKSRQSQITRQVSEIVAGTVT